MASTTIPRDYSLIGQEAQKAEEKGLASTNWYTTPIPCKRMREWKQSSDPEFFVPRAVPQLDAVSKHSSPVVAL